MSVEKKLSPLFSAYKSTCQIFCKSVSILEFRIESVKCHPHSKKPLLNLTCTLPVSRDRRKPCFELGVFKMGYSAKANFFELNKVVKSHLWQIISFLKRKNWIVIFWTVETWELYKMCYFENSHFQSAPVFKMGITWTSGLCLSLWILISTEEDAKFNWPTMEILHGS